MVCFSAIIKCRPAWARGSSASRYKRQRANTNLYGMAGVICWFVFAAAPQAADNYVGTWKLNLSKSTYSPGPPPKSQTTKVEAVEGGIKEVVDRVNAQGVAIHFEWTAKYDGTDYPVKGDPDRDSVSLRKIDDYTIEITSKKAGKTTTTTRSVIATDGRSRVVRVTGINAQGEKINNAVVFDRE